MNRFLSNRTVIAGFAVLALFVCARRAEARDIPGGNITTTVTITDDSRLVGDVKCNVPLTMADANGFASCIAFGAPHITLHLNGHTLTGPVNPLTDVKNCGPNAASQFGVGIYVNGQTDVQIEGPGVVQDFQVWGILLFSSTEVTVKGVTANYNCWAGMQTISLSDSQFEENNLVNNSLGSSFCGGICLANSSKNVVRKCKFGGNGTVEAPDGGGNADFGVSLEGTSNENRIEENDIEGNANGVFIFDSSTGNVIRHNTILGNPPAQLSAAFQSTGPLGTPADEQGFDIQDTSSGKNTFEDNVCLTYSGPDSPPPCPNVRKLQNGEDEDKDLAAAGQDRLALPQARPINAVFHLSGRPFPKAADTAQPGGTGSSNSVTVTGKVVDAACYMMHAEAATAASHKGCAAACLARGVPLAIAADDGTLYFPADGNQRLRTLLNARVRASGAVVDKHEPMELKMPVGDKNQMLVRVDGGYKQITIETLTRIKDEKQ